MSTSAVQTRVWQRRSAPPRPESQGGREEELNIRIGDVSQTISADTTTYVISYDVTGAMRSSNGYDEF
jgi:hypothetical protein